MNSSRIKQLLALIFVTVLANFAVAGPGVSGGGDAVKIGNKFYLLDLVEAGVEKNPYIQRDIEVNPKHLARLKVTLNDQFPHLLIAKKLAEIYKVNPFLAIAILKTIESYQWRVVSKSLIDIIDENTDLNIARKDLYQLAARKNVSILINQNLWAQIDEVQKTALVFHEALYAMNEPRYTGKIYMPGYPIKRQSSAEAREVNGYLFSDLPRQGRIGLDRLQGNLPGAFYRSPSADNAVFEDDFRISAAPFIQFVINDSKIWESSREAQAGVSPFHQGPISLETQAAVNCEISLQTGLMIDIQARANPSIDVIASTFVTETGTPRSYVSVARSGEYYRPAYYGLVKATDLKSCEIELLQRAQAALQDLKEKYVD